MPPSRFADIPVVKWLLISNIAVFVLGILLRPEKGAPVFFVEAGVFSIEKGIFGFQVWRFLTFQFLHANFMHLLMNMWAIFVFGPFMERWWRSKAFLNFYLLCGIGGALFYAVLVAVPGLLPTAKVETPLLGASAGVFGILVGVAIVAPQARIQLLFPPVAMKMRTFALAFLALEVVFVLMNSSNAGGSAGHLGGALVGLLLMKVTPLRDALIQVATDGKTVKTKRKKAKAESKFRPRSEASTADPSEVDRILDKINKEGLQSLTDKERELLKKAAGK